MKRIGRFLMRVCEAIVIAIATTAAMCFGAHLYDKVWGNEYSQAKTKKTFNEKVDKVKSIFKKGEEDKAE